MKDYTKEELYDFLVRRAGIVEDTIRLYEETGRDIFTDAYCCLREIMIQEEAFFEICEKLGLVYKIYPIDDSDYPYIVEAKIELFGQIYRLKELLKEKGDR